MKTIILALSLFLLPALSQATDAKDLRGSLYCESNGKLENALVSEDPYWDYNEFCKEALVLGEVCYKGLRKDVINYINLRAEENNPIGSDEDWIENARYAGKDLKYDWVDGPNDERTSYVIPACGRL